MKLEASRYTHYLAILATQKGGSEQEVMKSKNSLAQLKITVSSRMLLSENCFNAR